MGAPYSAKESVWPHLRGWAQPEMDCSSSCAVTSLLALVARSVSLGVLVQAKLELIAPRGASNAATPAFSALPPPPPLLHVHNGSVAVVGGSISYGVIFPRMATDGAPPPAVTIETYAELVAQHFGARFYNAATPATTSGPASFCLEHVLPEPSDLLIIEFALNDVQADATGTHMSVQASMERLLRRVWLRMPSTFVLLLHLCTLGGRGLLQNTSYSSERCHSVYGQLVAHYRDMPILVLHKTLDAKHMADDVHPDQHSHRGIAAWLISSLEKRYYADQGRPGERGRTSALAVAGTPRAHGTALPAPPTSAAARSSFLLTLRSREPFRGPLPKALHIDPEWEQEASGMAWYCANATQLTRALHRSEGFQLGSSLGTWLRQDKLGWNAASAGNRLSFLLAPLLNGAGASAPAFGSARSCGVRVVVSLQCTPAAYRRTIHRRWAGMAALELRAGERTAARVLARQNVPLAWRANSSQKCLHLLESREASDRDVLAVSVLEPEVTLYALYVQRMVGCRASIAGKPSVENRSAG